MKRVLKKGSASAGRLFHRWPAGKVNLLQFRIDRAASQRLYRSGGQVKIGTFLATKFKGPKSACGPCKFRSACLRHPERTEIRQVAYFHGRFATGKETFTERMQHKIDSAAGRALHGLRVAIAEPPFSHICRIMGLDRYTLRGKKKVNIQWNLYYIVHTLKRVA